MHYNCLIVEDEVDLAKATKEYFELFDVSCGIVSNPADCMGFLEENEVDVLLLDINLADESGFALCKKIREAETMPILFVSARQSDEDILVALNIGGDDYIKKPYNLSVLLAKVKAVLKRLEAQRELMQSAAEPGLRSSGPAQSLHAAGEAEGDGGVLTLHEATMSATVRGQKVQLKAKEFKLLQCLYENRGTIMTKQRLFDEVWGDAFFSDGTLNVHIRRIREKIEENPEQPKLIKTVWGTGYIMEI